MTIHPMRHGARYALMMLFLVGSCAKVSTGPDTITMLNSGDNRACSADDVHKLLQDLLAPQTPPTGTAQDNSAYLQAKKSISFGFNTTTMDSVDTAAHSMTCSTNANATIGNNSTGDQRIIYKIQPTSDSGPASFAITLPSDDEAARLTFTLLLSAEANRIELANQKPPPDAANAPVDATNAPTASEGEAAANPAPAPIAPPPPNPLPGPPDSTVDPAPSQSPLRDAIARALQSGEETPWRDGSDSGFVSVGERRAWRGLQCRTYGFTTNGVRSSVEIACEAADGSWHSAAAN